MLYALATRGTLHMQLISEAGSTIECMPPCSQAPPVARTLHCFHPLFAPSPTTHISSCHLHLAAHTSPYPWHSVLPLASSHWHPVLHTLAVLPQGYYDPSHYAGYQDTSQQYNQQLYNAQYSQVRGVPYHTAAGCL